MRFPGWDQVVAAFWVLEVWLHLLGYDGRLQKASHTTDFWRDHYRLKCWCHLTEACNRENYGKHFLIPRQGIRHSCKSSSTHVPWTAVVTVLEVCFCTCQQANEYMQVISGFGYELVSNVHCYQYRCKMIYWVLPTLWMDAPLGPIAIFHLIWQNYRCRTCKLKMAASPLCGEERIVGNCMQKYSSILEKVLHVISDSNAFEEWTSHTLQWIPLQQSYFSGTSRVIHFKSIKN